MASRHFLNRFSFHRRNINGDYYRPSVIITFDDALLGVYKNAYPIMKSLHFSGVCFAVTNLVGKSFEGQACMSRIMLQDLQNDGWEIGSHTHSHSHLDRLDENLVREELLVSRMWIEQNIFNSKPVISMSYPHSGYSKIAQSYYKCCRIGGKRYKNKMWDGKIFDKIPGTSITDATSYEIDRYLKKLKAVGGTLVLYFHNVIAEGTKYDTSPENFYSVMKSIYNQNMIVRTFKDLDSNC